ncbi:hypothetical protein FHQ26_11625 [Testudinibacter sp. TR-2022]|uniref:phage tail terminator protein n=1 Tax=Testudinibacter sp. TR-2022 TaxID=2585029 RepID=UPI00111A362A|nr:phage tail terminator protein [Testudinibacter sp. TR-2022]TNH04322.1 hypothetical protein FHQ22_04870 [Pasteurellaceae bacterium Phil31]TNH05753.1 hypothetical protein FHQ26_11625 [Testudinibacter sp. TR-2022]TNH07481.1 hypothetical protein FHQ25_11165 [Testudinibacter sp. TR-2022]
MQQAKAIRNHVFSHLSGHFPEIRFYHNGHLLVLNEAEFPALSVYIDELQTDSDDLCGSYWSGKLNVSLYVPAVVAEEHLDDLAEKVIKHIRKLPALDLLESSSLESIQYSTDDDNSVYRNAVLQYAISFYRNDEDSDEDDE